MNDDDLPIGWWCNAESEEMIYSSGQEGTCATVERLKGRQALCWCWRVKLDGVEVARGLVPQRSAAIIASMTALLVVLTNKAIHTRDECCSSVWLESIQSTSRNLAEFYGSDQDFLRNYAY